MEQFAGTKVEVTLLGKFSAGWSSSKRPLCRGFKNCWQMFEKTELKCLEVQVRSHQCIASIARRQCHLVVISAHSTTLKFPRALKFTLQAVAVWCRHLQGVNCKCDTKATSPGPQVKWACIPRWRNSTMVRCKRQRNIKNHDMIVLW